MESQPRVATKTDMEMEARMRAAAGDPERVDVIAKARVFKRSWIELAEALSGVSDRQCWERWGYDSFEAYCKKELHLTPATVLKLLGSFRFLQTSAPRVVERAIAEPSAPIPTLRAVNFVAKAEQRGAANEEVLREIRRAAFDEAIDGPALSRRFKAVAFPVAEAESEERQRERVAAAARRLATLLAEPGSPVPRTVAIAVEEALGQLIEALEPG
jgi:hypothetical protein